jgi:hypothetical protein
LLLTLTIALIINLALLFGGAWTTGISSDEPTHVERLTNFLNTGWYLQDHQLINDKPIDDLASLYVYAPATALLGHAVGIATGTDRPQIVGKTLSAYASRHLTIAVIAVIGIGATGLLSKHLGRTWLCGLAGASILAAIPMWTGHGMFNIKDIPVATGYTLTTLGLLALATTSIPSGPSRVAWRGLLPLVSGLTLALGTRPGLWPPLVLMTAIAAATAKQRQSKIAITLAAAMAAGCLIGMYPALLIDPINAIAESARGSSKFGEWNKISLMNGILHGQPAPWQYLPTWLSNQIPVGIGILAILGLYEAITNKGLRRRGSIYVLLQIFLVPAAILINQSVLYNGLRQIIFVLPALAALSALGLVRLAAIVDHLFHDKLRARCRPGIWSAAVASSLAVALPTWSQINLFPYNYTYYNEWASRRPIDGNWPTDYWRTSFREVMANLPETELAICPTRDNGSPIGPKPIVNADQLQRFACAKRATSAPYEPLRPRVRKSATKAQLQNKQFWLVQENQFGSTLLPANCWVESKVSRTLHGQAMPMATLARCELNHP